MRVIGAFASDDANVFRDAGVMVMVIKCDYEEIACARSNEYDAIFHVHDGVNELVLPFIEG